MQPITFSSATESLLESALPLRPALWMGDSFHSLTDALQTDIAHDTHRVTLVTDEPCRDAAGEDVYAQLSKSYNTSSIIFPAGITPAIEQASYIQRESERADVLVCVGSGTLNDLCKYASFSMNKPYVVIPTAPSMNGYVSASASLIINNHKQSLPAHMPLAVYANARVLAEAPARLIRSGLGDSLARSTAQADWLLSHLLLDTDYDERPFALLREYEPTLMIAAPNLLRGDVEAVSILFTVLLLSGFGMTICGSSAPASQGEHMIAHTVEAVHGHHYAPTYHGEQIGVTALTMSRLQEYFLHSEPRLSYIPDVEARIAQYFGPLAADMQAHYAPKRFTRERTEELFNRLRVIWPDLRARIAEACLPPEFIELALSVTDSPQDAASLGWDMTAYTEAVRHARFTRDRFTFLDLIA